MQVRCNLGGVFVVACSSERSSSTGENSRLEEVASIQQAATTRPEQPPDKEITIATVPHAKCFFHVPGKTDEDHGMITYADSGGLVHLWAPQVPEKYAIDCDENGTTMSRDVDLADPATFDPVAAPVAVENGRVLAALTEPMSLSQEELIQAGYPPRPDPVLAAPLYEQWLKLVSEPTTLVTPHYVERPDRIFDSFTHVTSSIWAGLAHQVNGRRYQWSLVSFNVPNASTPLGFSISESAYWGGVNANGPIIQDGVDIATTGSVKVFHAWIEYQPDPSQFNNNFTVAAGHNMTFWAWECNASKAVAVNGGYGCFWYKNNTTGIAITTDIRAIPSFPPGLHFDGETAEGVVERICTQISGSTCVAAKPLSNFGLLPMDVASMASDGTWHNFVTDHYRWYTMKNASAQTLANTVHYLGDATEVFSWVQAQ